MLLTDMNLARFSGFGAFGTAAWVHRGSAVIYLIIRGTSGPLGSSNSVKIM